MRNRMMPSHIMGVSLLYKCNFNCAHCGYIYIGDAEDHIIKPGYRLTWEQIKTAINDCVNIKGSQWNLNYTGGEPTLWEEGDRDFMDVLLETAKAGIAPSYNTNGSYFNDYDKTVKFFHRYIENSSSPLDTFISMDNFHNNYDREKGRAKSLDNIVKMLETIPADKKDLLRFHVIIIVTKDPNSSLPKEMKEYYGQFGISFGESPLQNIGKAKELKDELPSPEDIMNIFKKQFGDKLPLPPPGTEKGPGGLPPRFPMPDMSQGPRVVVLVGDDYYIGNKPRGRLGHMADLYPAA